MAQKAFFLVNPQREAGRSYLRALNRFPEVPVVALWTDPDHFQTWKHAAPRGLVENIVFNPLSTEGEWLKQIQAYQPLGFIAVDDSAVEVADVLQAHFFPEACNDPRMREIRSSKLEYSEFLRRKGLVLTLQFEVDNLVTAPTESQLTWPFIAKPLSGAGNEGVFLVESPSVWADISRHLQERPYFIQEYVGGREFCVEICSHGELHTCTTVMEYGRMYLEDGKAPWRYDNDLISPTGCEEIIAYSIDVVKALGVRHGVSWLQIRFKNGRPTLIECNFRSQGHAHYDALSEATGITFADVVVRSHIESHPSQLEKQFEKHVAYQKFGDFKKLSINNRVPKYVGDLDLTEILKLPSTRAAYRNPFVIPGFAGKTTCFKNNLAMILMQNNDSLQFNRDLELVAEWQSKVEW